MKIRLLYILLVLCALVTLVGCKQLILGTKAPAGKSVQLVEGSPQTGTWTASEFVMHYEYIFSRAKENDFGLLEYSAFIEKTAARLDSLSVWIYLLDANRKVIELKRLYDSGYKDPAYMEKSLARQLTVMMSAPPETAAISFAYTAAAWNGGSR
ncbi:MAG: hypothetical protein WAK57_18805 [Desulfobacterales bacterium]